MKIINEGTYDIRQFAVDLSELEYCARVCYQSNEDRKGLAGEKFIEWLLNNKHESVIEHSLITVAFNNVSRGFTHELVRHRIAAYSQESTRYTDPKKSDGEFKVIMKEGLNLDKDYHIKIKTKNSNGEDEEISYVLSTNDFLKLNEQMYSTLLEDGWEKNDARQILPNGIKSQIVISTNVREWRHILKLRTSSKAHWEIRNIMRKLLKEFQDKVPILFDDIVF